MGVIYVTSTEVAAAHVFLQDLLGRVVLRTFSRESMHGRFSSRHRLLGGRDAIFLANSLGAHFVPDGLVSLDLTGLANPHELP